ncbi:hypothetical protein FSP39_002203 [Pinctada imbricata]|uniref:Uncharacterized protein n=1 Tax=Pinctada imbricata TaxID=66713 RepID=A0AA88XVA8_PINIB|nr:hypothetical protein FSP39_002203 [Pinctada imbricata]
MEVLENHLDRGIECRFGDRVMMVGNKQNAKFTLLEDNYEYNVSDVVERRRLPVIVEFVHGSEEFLSNDIKDCVRNYKNFTGRYVLNSLVTKKVVIGHFKPTNRRAMNSYNGDVYEVIDNPANKAENVSSRGQTDEQSKDSKDEVVYQDIDQNADESDYGFLKVQSYEKSKDGGTFKVSEEKKKSKQQRKRDSKDEVVYQDIDQNADESDYGFLKVQSYEKSKDGGTLKVSEEKKKSKQQRKRDGDTLNVLRDKKKSEQQGKRSILRSMSLPSLSNLKASGVFTTSTFRQKPGGLEKSKAEEGMSNKTRIKRLQLITETPKYEIHIVDKKGGDLQPDLVAVPTTKPPKRKHREDEHSKRR